MTTRPLLSEEHRTEHVSEKMGAFHPSVISEVVRTVERDPLVVVGMSQNPFVRKARRALDEAGLTFTYLEYGSYLSAWKERLAIKMWSGWPTFPQVFVRGTLIGGFGQMMHGLGDGTLRERLQQT